MHRWGFLAVRGAAPKKPVACSAAEKPLRRGKPSPSSKVALRSSVGWAL